MKTLTVDREGKLSIAEIPVPSYGECQALVKMKSCGVCSGTDLKLIHGTFKNFHSYPAILGHEGVGEVIDIGSQVTGLKKGDIVLLPFLEENIGELTPGWGAYSEYAVVGDPEAYIRNGMGEGTDSWKESCLAQTLIKPDDRIDSTQAAMVITFREVLSAIRRFGFKPNENVLIFGAGPVGLSFTKFAKLIGMKTVITADVKDEKVAEAKNAGADYAFNSTKCDIEAEVKKLFPEGIDYIVDAVGLNSLINQAMRMIRYNGKICCYGISPKLGMELDWSEAPYNWTLQFIQWPSKKEEGEAHTQIMAWINQGVLDPMDYISDVFTFDHILEAFELIEARKPGTKKVIIKYE